MVLGVMVRRILLLRKKKAVLRKLGFREVGKRRKVAGQGRFLWGRGSSGAGRLDVDEVIRQLRLFSEEDRGRCIRPFTVHCEEDLSGLSDANSGGAANRAAPLIGDSVLTPYGYCSSFWGSFACSFNSSFLVGSGNDSKGFKIFQKVKMHVFFPFNAIFQSRWHDGGSAAWSAAAFEEPRDIHGKQAAAAPDGMPGCCVAEADLCCDVSEIAATDLQDTMNSFGIGDNSATIVSGDNGRPLFAATDLQDAPNSHGIGDHRATIVLGTMVALYLLRLILRLRRIHKVSRATKLLPVSRVTLVAQLSDSSYHPSMHVRILVLVCVGLGLGLGLVWESVHVCRVVFFLVLQMMWMPAWMVLHLMEFVLPLIH